ncbi:CaiB/BaiF CoA transferase family protein [Paracoccus alkenifer]|uniref:Crotonobetainyl-CoA:carnitine CoA-transferase CaiB n=1 Tax=Paracoccus alkenifer TaxID=65735 RepID=A0A1H6K8R3_9RHOB|nr:CoA transferase [Paracoccus alkenifer]SEH67850.1 Crotonobetainyl-CoA:carnitine CoA-transferase CaiB [Paracoccus alkenifer]
MTLPLDGVRIISVEQYGAGPFGTQHLADLGAEVIKIENPADGGDVGRHVGPHFFEPGDSHFFQSFNRNKRSLTLDLKSDEGQEVLRKLAARSDAVFNNLRGDLPERLGVTYDALKDVNPALVCAHLSAYGREGPRKAWPGYDYLAQAEAGYLSLTGEPDGPPARFGISIIDMMTGTMAALATVSAILGARATGQGRDIDTCLFEVALHNLSYLGTWYMNDGVKTERLPRSSHPSLTPSQLYRTGDGWIFIMCNKEKFWPVLAQAIGRPEWADDPRYADFKARLENRAQLTDELDEVLSTRTTAEWMRAFGGKVPAAPVYDVAQALDNPYVKEQEFITEVPHPVRGTIKTLACPIRIPGETLPARPAPRLGADTLDILQSLERPDDRRSARR